MSILILIHVVAGFVGIAAGGVVLVGTYFRKRMPRWNALFLCTTGSACATGLVFLPIDGWTSAQVVAVFTATLLAVAAYALYIRGLSGSWDPVYAVAVVGAVFLNVLIATAQAFQHVRWLKDLAPTQGSWAYVAVKAALLLAFTSTALVVARRLGR